MHFLFKWRIIFAFEYLLKGGTFIFINQKQLLAAALSAGIILGSAMPAMALPAVNRTVQTTVDDSPALPVNIMATQQQTDPVQAKIQVKNRTGKSATLTWNSDSPFAIYNVYQYDYILKSWALYTQVRVNTVELTGLTPAMFYKFKITVPGSDGVQESTVGQAAFYARPAAAKLQLSVLGATEVTLKWSTKYTPAYYELYRAGKDGKYQKISKISGKKRSYTDTDVSPKTAYSYKIRTVVENRESKGKSRFSDVVTVKTAKTLKLPKVSGACKTYAYYDAVTDKTSPAYAVLNSGTYRGVTYKTTTDETTGIRMVGEYYCAALGTFYGTTKGTKYKVTLDTGKTFKIILCDTKSNRHTDKKHQYAKKNKDVVEFYVDRTKIPAGVNGNYNRLEQFHGKIQSIELLTESES